MIQKVSKDWSEVEAAATRLEGDDSEEVNRLVQEISGVRQVLSRMCQVSVTRTTLKEAVREALFSVIAEHRSELFPELEGLDDKILSAVGKAAEGELPASVLAPAGVPEEVTERMDVFEERVARLAALREDVSRLDERLDALQGEVQTVQGEVRETQGAEQELRKEIEQMVEALTEKLSEVQSMLARMETNLPERQAVDEIGARIGRMEEQLGELMPRVSDLDSVTPEIRSLAARFTEVRQYLEKISGEVGEGNEGARQTRQALAERLAQLEGTLNAGIERWEEDQSATRDRLAGIRDTLRAQLEEVGAQAQSAKQGFVGKLMKKEPKVKLKQEELSALSTKIQGIVEGLDGILAGKQRGGS